ncbi:MULTISPECIES: hypothetical protein [Chitinophagaceae]
MRKYLYHTCLLVCSVTLSWFVSCRKDVKNNNSHSLSPQETKAKEWLSENGGMFRNGTLTLNSSSGGGIVGKLQWDSTKEYAYGGFDYMEIPFRFGNLGSVININDTLGDQSFVVVIRKDSSGKYEGALRTTNYRGTVTNIGTREKSIHNIQSYILLDGKPSSFWYKTEEGLFVLGRRLTDAEVKTNVRIKTLDMKAGPAGGGKGKLMMAQPPSGGGVDCITISVPITVSYVVDNSGPNVIIGTYTYTEYVNVCYEMGGGTVGGGGGAVGGGGPAPGGSGGSSDYPPANDLAPVTVKSLKSQIKNKPFALLPSDIDCETIKKWLNIAKFTAQQDIVSKLNNIRTVAAANSGTVAGTMPTITIDDIAHIQNINDAYSEVVNMDYFPVNVTKLPNGYTAEQFEHYIRVNINDFVDNSNSTFTPYQWYGVNDVNLWNSSNPYGAVVSIDIKLSGQSFFGDDGSVVVTKVSSNGWTFTTIHDPYNGDHPVSGNREFGFTANANGSYTFYTRGVDRLTSIDGGLLQNFTNFPFNSADGLWGSFQNKIKDFVNSHGGSASLSNFLNVDNKGKQVANSYQYYRPDWQKVKDVLDGKLPLSTLSKDCPD